MYPYITAFHNLGGNTIGEHKRNFNNYLSSLRDLPADRVNQIIENLKPLTLQEEIFHAKIQITFKHYEELLKTFYKGNIIVNKIIINTAFDDLFGKMDADTFTEKICPNISRVMRIKLINKLARKIENPSVGDSFYHSILRRYGLKMAENLLVCCSEEVIREHKTKFTFKQLIRLHTKYPKFLKFYMENTSMCIVSTIAQYLSNNDLQYYYQNFKYFCHMKIGRKGFTNVINHYKNELLKDPLKFVNILHPRILLKKLTNDEHAVLISNLLPKEKHDFNFYGIAYRYTKMLPLNIRGDIFSKAYKENYGCEIFVEKLAYEFISIFSWEFRSKCNLNELEHLPLFQTKYSIPKIKTIIKQITDCTNRNNLLLQLLETCKVNQDFEALLDVLKYVSQCHINETLPVKRSVLKYLLENFKLENLQQRHWDCINEFLEDFCVHGVSMYNEYQHAIEKRIVFKLLNDIDCLDDLSLLLKLFDTNSEYNLLKLRMGFEKDCLTRMSQFVESSAASIAFCKSIYDYNLRNKKLRINYFDYPSVLNLFVDSFIKLENVQHEQEIICDIILMNGLKPEQAEIQKGLRRRYFEFCFFLPRKICVWLLNNAPEFIAANLPRCLDCYRPYEIEMLRFSKIHQKIEEYYLEKLQHNEDVGSAVNFLSYSPYFIEFTNKYTPLPGCKINLRNNYTKKVLNIQRYILGAIKYTPLPHKFLDVILNFSKGDYLQFALQPLYSACSHIPEKELVNPLRILSQRSVSVRKHAVHLTVSYLSVSSIYANIAWAFETENNSSVKKFIIKTCLKFFIYNPTDDSFKLLKDSLNQQNDPEIRSLLYDFKRINRTYLADYIKLVWNFSEEKDLSIINEIDSAVIHKLDNAFCDEVLAKSIFHECTGTKNFICIYLLFAGEVLQYRAIALSQCIIRYIDKGTSFQQITDLKGKAYLLIESISVFLVREKSLITVKALQESFENISIPYNKFLFEVLFDTTVFFMEHEGNSFHKCFAKFLHDYCLLLIEKYGDMIFDYYKEFLQHYLKNLFFTIQGRVAEHFMLLVEELLEMQCDVRTQLLAVYLLPEDIIMGSKEMERYSVLVDKLAELESPIVVLHLERRLRGF